MRRPALNPYLPSYEYVADGEPYVFDGRLYIYGSHDCFDGEDFCLNDYVCWSAPVNDLGNWRNEGIIYRKTQDPLNADGSQNLFAPDVQQGTDGRYYLFYCLHHSPTVSVAVCDTPAGEYAFLGHVRHQDGELYGRKPGDVFNFDPGVLLDADGRLYLYTGIA
ncbi:family 43 glycosylhydrolase, partial [Ruminococcaceae bacterium OttesenSCG-928-A11]|nr:family 43 glycosylhydrolase [Ruminococcaceae bacterium OttesenSCG-928-A11]